MTKVQSHAQINANSSFKIRNAKAIAGKHFAMLAVIIIIALLSPGLNLLTVKVAAEPTAFMVTFKSNNTAADIQVGVSANSLLARPADPVWNGFQFAGWFTTSAYTGNTSLVYAWDFSQSPVTSDLILYAKWIYIRNDGMPAAGSPLYKAVDISQYNDSISSAADDISFTTLKTQVDLIYIRAVSHNSSGPYIDYQASAYATSAQAVDLPFGFYYYFYPRANTEDSKAHANFFYNFIKQYPYRCVPVLDVEESNGLTSEQVMASVLSFTQEFKRISGQDVMLYCSTSFATGTLTSALNQYRLWTANWNVTAPLKNTIWSTWDMWQYSAAGVVPGIPKAPVDLDYATGNVFLKPVSYNTLGAGTDSAVLASYGSTIPRPADPARTGYSFHGWYQDEACTIPWDFAANVATNALTLFAKWMPDLSIQAFVTRFYQYVLGREPDPGGLNDWVSQLVSQSISGAQLSFGFIMSPEFQAQQLSDSEYVTRLYRVFFNREPDPDGLAGWLQTLGNGMSRYYVMAGFVGSDEFLYLCSEFKIARGSIELTAPMDLYPATTAFVNRLYKICLNRSPDERINDWVGSLKTGNNTGKDLVYGFLFSSEFTGKGIPDSDYITILYQAILNRQPDPVGYQNWLNILSGQQDRYAIMAGFINSDEFKALCQSYGINSGVA